MRIHHHGKILWREGREGQEEERKGEGGEEKEEGRGQGRRGKGRAHQTMGQRFLRSEAQSLRLAVMEMSKRAEWCMVAEARLSATRSHGDRPRQTSSAISGGQPNSSNRSDMRGLFRFGGEEGGGKGQREEQRGRRE